MTLAGFAYMMDCGSVDDPIVEVPQSVSNIITVADNMDKIDAVGRPYQWSCSYCR